MRARTRAIAIVVGAVVVAAAFVAGALAPDLLRDDRGEVPGTRPVGDVLAESGEVSGGPDEDPDDDPADAADAGPSDDEGDDGGDDPATPDDDPDDGAAEGDGEGDGADVGATDDEAGAGIEDLALPGWIAVVRSLSTDERTAEDAAAEAVALQEAGADDVRVLRSDDLDGLEPGYWVLHAGGGWPDDAEDDARGTCADLAGTVDCYVRRVDAPAA